MAYPGVALLAMVGIGFGFALWYFLADSSSHSQGQGPHNSGAPPPGPAPNNSWDVPRDARRRRRRGNAKATDDCPICTEPMNGTATETSCGHMFHDKCISQWREVFSEQPNPATCPICRQGI